MFHSWYWVLDTGIGVGLDGMVSRDRSNEDDAVILVPLWVAFVGGM